MSFRRMCWRRRQLRRSRRWIRLRHQEELGQRRDFRGLSIVTIDGETARDFDDAVLVRPLPNGNWELQVHIADVSYYVRPGTSLDLEARLRGTSVYFPDRAVPMLPPQLSSGMCSLRPDEDRLVLSCVMEIDGRGEVLGYQVCEGIIRSAKRMTYTQVQGVLDGNAETRAEFVELVPEFERMYELCVEVECEAASARIDRLRSAGTGHSIRSGWEYGGDRAIAAGMVAPADRRVHAKRE